MFNACNLSMDVMICKQCYRKTARIVIKVISVETVMYLPHVVSLKLYLHVLNDIRTCEGGFMLFNFIFL